MYKVGIKDHIMIGHSLKGAVFGPAQNMHGATYNVTAIFCSSSVSEDNIVIDMGRAHEVIKEVLAPLNYQNLDELPIFKDCVTTTEFLAKHIHDTVKTKVAGEFNGTIEIILDESHVAWASYSGE